MVTVDTETRSRYGTPVLLLTRWTVFIVHTLGTPVLPGVTHQIVWTVSITLNEDGRLCRGLLFVSVFYTSHGAHGSHVVASFGADPPGFPTQITIRASVTEARKICL